MGDVTKISWTADAQGNPGSTFNPWVGCTKVSPGCASCYAADYDKRVGGAPIGQRADKTKPLLRWGPGAPRTRTSAAYWRKPIAWNRAAEKSGVRRKVFCGSLCDVFDAEVDSAWKADLWALITETPCLDWLLLTKRAERLAEELRDVPGRLHAKCVRSALYLGDAWPLRNVWLGVTVENQEQAEKRIPLLLAQKAAVRFLSAEPMLGPVDLTGPWPLGRGENMGLDWVICGGESGPKARPFDLAWARSIRDQCKAAGVAFFCKQLGARPRGDPDGGPEDEGLGYEEERIYLRDSHGADPSEWPEDLRIRDFPTPTQRSTT